MTDDLENEGALRALDDRESLFDDGKVKKLFNDLPVDDAKAKEIVRKELERDQLEDERLARIHAQAVVLCAKRVIDAWIKLQQVLDTTRLTDPEHSPEQWRKLMIAMLGVGDACIRLQRSIDGT